LPQSKHGQMLKPLTCTFAPLAGFEPAPHGLEVRLAPSGRCYLEASTQVGSGPPSAQFDPSQSDYSDRIARRIASRSGANLGSAGDQLADDLAEPVHRNRQVALLGEQLGPWPSGGGPRATGRGRMGPSGAARPCQTTTGTLLRSRSNPQGRVNARSSSNQPQMPLASAWRNDAAT